MRLEDAVKYYSNEYNKAELEECTTLDEVADVLNRYSDDYGNGAYYEVR